ncbi:isocitrate lyase/PEP mutase family protein [Roseovarius indicus]|uniref:isocitrate lyase/PEP mutase family protein n=1 Tax=Roseovarius indicus TaxID=540747 RepID=UPI0032EFC45A
MDTETTPPDRSSLTRRQRLRALIDSNEAFIVPGVANALGARLVEQAGFGATYITGAGVANSHLGMPDLGLLTLTELAETTARIADACTLPLLVDIDTGFGNAVNVNRTIKVLERAGASAVQIEDQVFPKKCGHFDGKQVIPLPEMLGKVKAALDARVDPDLLVVARTDAAAVTSMDDALDRAHAFIETGADIVFVEAPRSRDDIERIAALPVPTVMNIVIGGRTPMLSMEELSELGFSIVLYANALLQITIASNRELLGVLGQQGSLIGFEDRLASFDERQKVLGMDDFTAMEKRYAEG